MLSSLLIERLHEGASIQRWNDFAKPAEFTELDKQAHKMIIAYVLGMTGEDAGEVIDWVPLIEGGIFEFLHRIVLTDIKPHVFHRMMDEKGAELNRWILGRLAAELAGTPGGFANRFRAYLFDDQYAVREKSVLRAAHYLATHWEFNVIYRSCPFLYGIEQVKRELEAQLAEHRDLPGVRAIAGGGKLKDFVSLCGQLRFQKRWSETPRIPETSVLGHMLLVATMSYLLVLEFMPCPRRARNSFFCALFHDLPEVLTRDIASPIKTAVEGLEDLIKEYEKREMEEKLLPMLSDRMGREIRSYTEDEFDNRATIDQVFRKDIPFLTFQQTCNEDQYEPIDGELIRVCDHLAAFVEATLSISHGITSKTLRAAHDKLLHRYSERTVGGLPVGRLFTSLAISG